MSRICQQCRHANPMHAYFCRTCGGRIPLGPLDWILMAVGGVIIMLFLAAFVLPAL